MIEASRVLTYGQKILRRVIAGLDKPGRGQPGGCFASCEVLGQKIGTGKSQAAALADQLKDLGLIVCRTDGKLLRRFPAIPVGVVQPPLPTRDWSFARRHAWVMEAATRLDAALTAPHADPGLSDTSETEHSGFSGREGPGLHDFPRRTFRLSRLSPSDFSELSAEGNNPQILVRSESLTTSETQSDALSGVSPQEGSEPRGANPSIAMPEQSDHREESTPLRERTSGIVTLGTALEGDVERNRRVEENRVRWLAALRGDAA